MTDQTKSLTTKSNGTALASYGQRDDVKEMEARILAMIPGADKYSPGERRALAQISVAHGLSPFNGECWNIPGRGAMVGIKGLRKHAHSQISGNYWIEYFEITDPEQRKRWKIGPGELAFEARLFDNENISTFVSAVERLTKAGIPWEAVKSMVGDKPYTTGYGVLGDGESTKMNRVQCARKRAEANAIKQRFDIPFGLTVADEDTGEIIEGSAVEVGNTPPYIDNAAADADIVSAESKREAMFGPKE
jgi:hypothetical protein